MATQAVAASAPISVSRTRRRSRSAPSSVEDKRALERVVATHVEVDAELVVLGAVARALAHEHRRARHRREYGLRQGRRGSAGALVGFELGVARVADLEGSLAPLHVERDGHLLDGNDFADQLYQLGDRAAQLPGVDAQDGFLLLWGDLVVEIDRGPPVTLENVAWNVSDGADRATRDVDAVDRAFVEVPANDRVAGSEVGIFADPARTEHTTVAHFEKSSFQVICHGDLLA